MYRRLADADATRSFFRADGNDATDVASLRLLLLSLLLKLQHSRLSLTGVAAFGRDVYHADYQALVKFLPLEFTGENFHKSLSMCKLHITPIHKRY